MQAYESSDGAWTRWKLLRLARKTPRADARTFLKAEALKPVPRNGPAPERLATSTGDEEITNRIEAALGLLDAMPASESDVEEVIATVEEGIARILGSELFVRGLLTEARQERARVAHRVLRGAARRWRLPVAVRAPPRSGLTTSARLPS